MRWNECYTNEYELVQALRDVNIENYIQRRFNGYMYIEGLKKVLDGGNQLTARQLTQLKRLAYEIYKYHNWN